MIQISSITIYQRLKSLHKFSYDWFFLDTIPFGVTSVKATRDTRATTDVFGWKGITVSSYLEYYSREAVKTR